MEVDGLADAFLSMDSDGDGVVNMVKFFGAFALYFRHGGKCGKVGADEFPFIFIFA